MFQSFDSCDQSPPNLSKVGHLAFPVSSLLFFFFFNFDTEPNEQINSSSRINSIISPGTWLGKFSWTLAENNWGPRGAQAEIVVKWNTLQFITRKSRQFVSPWFLNIKCHTFGMSERHFRHKILFTWFGAQVWNFILERARSNSLFKGHCHWKLSGLALHEGLLPLVLALKPLQKVSRRLEEFSNRSAPRKMIGHALSKIKKKSRPERLKGHQG